MTSVNERRSTINRNLAQRYELIAPFYAAIARRALQIESDGERLTIPQFRTMQILGRVKGSGATNLDLARKISVSPPAMTAMVDGLVDRGLATRTTDPENRRQVLILLTPAGFERLADTTNAVLDRLALGMAELSDQEAHDLGAGLDALEKAMRFGATFDD